MIPETSELLLAVDMDNAMQDGAELTEPNWQLLITNRQYCLQYVAGLLATAHKLRLQANRPDPFAAYGGNAFHAYCEDPI